MTHISETMARFWARVDVRGPDECWPWKAGLSGNGYGRFKLDGKDVPAHRVAYAGEAEPIPAGAELLHGCDNPPGCNPRHLSPGTHRANMADMAAKGRAARTKGAAQLTPPRRRSWRSGARRAASRISPRGSASPSPRPP